MWRRVGNYVRRNHLGLLALFIALGGTAYALEANSVKSRHIKDGQVKRPDLSQRIATHAYSNDVSSNAMPDGLEEPGNPMGTLNISQAGRYVINARFTAFNGGSDSDVDSCHLGTEASLGDIDAVNFDVAAAAADNEEVVAMQGVHHFEAPGAVTLSCSDEGDGAVEVQNGKLLAVRVAGETFAPAPLGGPGE